jgi:SAM-dependent methyltransferase
MAPLLSGWIERRRLEVARPYVRGDVLDLGCGRGSALSLLGPDQNYLGVEVHAQYFRPPAGQTNRIAFLTLDLDRDELDIGRQFDTILMLAVIEHLRDPDRLLAQVRPLMKEGAKLVLTTPTPAGHVEHRIGAQLGLFWKSAVEEHKWAFSRRALESRLRMCGLSVEKHSYFLMGGNQLFVCTVPAEESAP